MKNIINMKKRNKNKKGQITLFIIIAVVIVAVILLIIFLQKIPKKELLEADVAKIKSYLSDCLELKTKESILVIAKQGSYYIMPDESIEFLTESVPYYWLENKSLVPSIETVEQELASYIKESFSECITDIPYITGLEEYESNFSTESCSAEVEIAEQLVKITIYCPVTIKKIDVSSIISDFDTEIECGFKKLYSVSSQIVNDYAENPGYLCLSCLDDLIINHNVTIGVNTISIEEIEDIAVLEENYIFIVTDKNLFNGKNLSWQFILKK